MSTGYLRASVLISVGFCTNSSAIAQLPTTVEENSAAARRVLVGNPAPPFPQGKWFNTKPLTLESPYGKIVVIDFWATWCAPSQKDLPKIQKVHDDSSDLGIVVIGVHPADTEPAEIGLHLRKRNLSYPVLLELPQANDAVTKKSLFEQFGIRTVPYAVVIDQEGKVAGEGQLDAVLTQAEELAKKTRP